MRYLLFVLLLFVITTNAQEVGGVIRKSLDYLSEGELPDSVVWQDEVFDSLDRFYINRASDSAVAFRIDTNGTGYFLYNVGVGVDSAESSLHIKNVGSITEESGILLENEDAAEKIQVMLSDDYGDTTSGVSIYDPDKLKSLIEFGKSEVEVQRSYFTLYNPAGTKFYLVVNNDSTLSILTTKP